MTKGEIAIAAFEIINSLMDKTIESVSDNFLPLLDKMVFLTPEILGFDKYGNITGNTEKFTQVFLAVANSLILALLIFLGIKSIFAYFFSEIAENPWRIIIRIIIIGILMNSSYFITYGSVWAASELTEGLRNFIGDETLSFSKLNETVNDLIETIDDEEIDVFSAEGIISTFIHFSVFLLSITYAMRFILLKILIIASPIPFLFFMNKSTEKIFKFWFKLFSILLFLQIAVALILGITYIIPPEENLFYKLIICGIISLLYVLNTGVYLIIKEKY